MSGAPAHPAIDLGQLSSNLAKTCSHYLAQSVRGLQDAVRIGEGGLAVAERRARVLDGLLNVLFCATDAAARQAEVHPQGRLALVAVGSYGRRTLSLHSDVDVIFLCDEPEDPHLAALTEGILYPLWDLGLRVGHAVRGLDETLVLAREDLSTATTLLDLRRVAGDADIVRELLDRGRKSVFEEGLAEFLDSLETDTLERHDRYGGSLYLLEPEVKLGRGGLRDVDVALWAARATWGVRDIDSLVAEGGLLLEEGEDLLAALEFLWRVRNLLHLHAKRPQDRLTFDEQERIATELGFVTGVTLAVEQFMQAYYRHARAVAGTTERVFRRARPSEPTEDSGPTGLRRGIVARAGELGFVDEEALDADPVLALDLYADVLQYRMLPEHAARDAVFAASQDPEWCRALRQARGAAGLFRELLTHVGEVRLRANSMLGELHEVGLLLAMIPEFEPVTGRVQHDTYHVYTVDVHSIAAVDRLRSLMRGDLRDELPLASRAAKEVERPLPLFLGLLLHDIGKARGNDHSREGAVMARPIAERLELSPVDVHHVVWLVQEHLSLYHWATRRDTTDPSTSAQVARDVGSVDRLRDLFLLTVSDLSTTNPHAMTSWRARMLGDLYISTSEVLVGGRVDRQERANEVRQQVRVGFVGDLGQEQLEAFVDQMPERYLLAHPVDVIRAHARAVRDRGDSLVHISTFPGPSADVSELLVVTDDRPGLLADVAAALSANRLEITGAQIYDRVTERGVEAVDLFYVRRSGDNVDDLEFSEQLQVARDIEALMFRRTTGEALLEERLPKLPSWAIKRGPRVTTRVAIDNDASPRFTVVDVRAKDHTGLLFTIAQTLRDEGLSIALSKVNTEGQKASDVFYVERAEGGKLSDPERAEALRERLFQAIEASRAARGIE